MEELTKQTDAVFMTETLFDGQAEQGVELDYVLPDYYPEIFRILKCCLSPKVISAAVSGNKLVLDGVVLIKVLYLEENSTALHCVEQRYTYSKTVDISGKSGGVSGTPTVTVIPRTDYCNCRAVSSRRIDVRGAVSCKITVTCPAKFQLPAIPAGMQVLRREINCCSEPIYSEKSLTIREEIETGASGIEYIVSCDAVPRVTDTRIIANKAVVKGTVTVSALYGIHSAEHSGCDDLEKMTADIPISQIIDMPGLTDQHSCRPEFIVRNCELIPKTDNGILSCELLIECRCNAAQEMTAEIPCDLYSTEFESDYTTASLKIPCNRREVNGQLSLKSGLTCDSGEIDSVWDCRSELYNVMCRPDGENGLMVTGQLCVQAIGRCSGGVPFFAEKQEAFEQTIPAAGVTPETSISHREIVTDTGFSIRSDGALDITAQAEFTGTLVDDRQITAISSAALHEDKPKERSDEFALRICYTNGGETCWDIAKRCNTTVEAIMSENDIQNRDAELSGMVIIPIV
ncbi:MAG: SPOCS domain-containing protein [Oscillospiraceae bacterium]